ncbi:hypothetical protein ACH47Z_41180 [Streptomyces sp. NPDC020192]
MASASGQIRRRTVGHGEGSSGLAYDGLHLAGDDPHALGSEGAIPQE